METRIAELRYKEVISVTDGSRYGYVGDVDIDLDSGQVRALIIPGQPRFFGLFGRGEDYYIPWECVQKFGCDIVIVDKPFQRRDPPPQRKKRRLKSRTLVKFIYRNAPS